MLDQYPAAPWSTALRALSVFSTVLLLVFSVVAYRSIPAREGFTHLFGQVIALALPATLPGALLFVVTGFAIDGRDLFVRRLLWSTRIPLTGLVKAYHDPSACRRSIRLFGNGGLYSFTGVFQNKSIGRYRLFGTDHSQAVVLVFERRSVVVTPASPQAFLRSLCLAVPAADVTVTTPDVRARR